MESVSAKVSYSSDGVSAVLILVTAATPAALKDKVAAMVRDGYRNCAYAAYDIADKSYTCANKHGSARFAVNPISIND